jgi:O-antigen/teichoic acid export membrane protein
MQRLLNYLQQLLRIDVRSTLRSGSWLSLNYGVQIGVGVITTVALANLLSKESLGTYQYIIAVAGVLSIFTLTGLGTAITRGVALGHEGLLRSSVWLKLKWSIGIVLTSAAVAAYYLYNGNFELGLAFLIVGACAPFIESFKLYENYLHGKEAFRDTVLLGAWRKPLPLLATVATAWFYPEPLALITAYFLSNAISLALVYFSVIKKYNPPSESHAETVTYSKHLSVIRSIGIASSHFDKLLLWHFLGPVAVASFTIAQLAVRYSGVFLNTLSALALPRFSKRDLPTLQRTLPRKVALLTVGMLFAAISYAALAPFFFPILFPQYPESIILSQVLALAFFLIPRSLYTQALSAHRQTKAQYILSIATPITHISLLIILIPMYGLWGAVYAQLSAGFSIAVLTYILFKRAQKIEPLN